MTAVWCCIDCDTTVELDRHGRCGACCSDAVVSMKPSGIIRSLCRAGSPVPEFEGRALPIQCTRINGMDDFVLLRREVHPVGRRTGKVFRTTSYLCRCSAPPTGHQPGLEEKPALELGFAAAASGPIAPSASGRVRLLPFLDRGLKRTNRSCGASRPKTSPVVPTREVCALTNCRRRG